MRFCALIVLLMTGVVSCGSAPRPNILLVVIDTLRADRLGCYGNERGLTPFLDSLAERGTVMHRAYAQSAWTSPSIASLFTSRFQSQHHVIRKGSLPSQREVTLAEILRDSGYVTGGFSANGLLLGFPDRMNGGSLRQGRGFGQGFTYFETKPPKRIDGSSRAMWETVRADEINRDAMKWLDGLPERGASPVFLYLHYMEPHIPYAPEEEFLRHACAGRDLPDTHRVNHFAYHGNRAPTDDSILRDIEAVYDAMVMSVDAGLRRLFAELHERGFLDDAIVVVTADHGEEFKEHGLLGHGKSLHEAVIRVPLLILAPGQFRRVDSWEVVSLVDVAPTLVDWLRIEGPDSFEGQSFRPDLLRGTSRWRALLARAEGMFTNEPRAAYSELLREKGFRRLGPHERALVTSTKKVILGVDGESEFYDIGRDPAEKNPEGLPLESRAALLETLVAKQRQASSPASATGVHSPDPATKEILWALGYTDD